MLTVRKKDRLVIHAPCRQAALACLALSFAACGTPATPAADEVSAFEWRQPIDGDVAMFKSVGGNIVYVLSKDGTLWRENGDYTQRTPVDWDLMPNTKSFQPIDGNIVFVLGSDGKLWREHGDYTHRDPIDSGVIEFYAVDATTIYVHHGYDAKLWRESGDASHSTQVDDNVLAFQPIDANVVYVMGGDLRLWRDHPDYLHRDFVDANVGTFRALDAATIYVKGSDGKLWREHGDSTHRDPVVDSKVRAFAPLGTVDVYVEGADGKLWREFGDMHDRDYVDQNLYDADARIDAFQPIYTSAEPYGHGMVLVLGSDGNLWREFMPYHAPPCTTSGNPVGGGGCCGGLEVNQTNICVPADPPGCGVTTLGGAPPCCRNKPPCDGNGVCVVDPQNGYHYCTPRSSGTSGPCPGGAAATLFGCKVTDCPYTDGNLASAYFCSKDDAEAQEQADNPQCSDISCSAL